jgi:hypothetical protein
MKRSPLPLILFVFFLLAACNVGAIGSIASLSTSLPSNCPDGSCGKVTKVIPSVCPKDCDPAVLPSSTNSGVVPGDAPNTFWVTNPVSGANLFVTVFFPDNWDGKTKLAALVLVPGGSSGSDTFTKKTPNGDSTVLAINQSGLAAVIFDPDGRGKSQGQENYDGFAQQDGLAEVIRFAGTISGVDSTRLGLATFSYGITMGSGVLARYPDLSVRFLIDWEGPANRDDTGGCDNARVGHLREIATCADETFWAEREASAFIGKIRIPYQRIQSEKDHAQPDYAHTVLMINHAVEGGVPWVRLNDESPNQTYTLISLPRMLPESMDRERDQRIARYAMELFDL